jgi:hypothetical protein
MKTPTIFFIIILVFAVIVTNGCIPSPTPTPQPPTPRPTVTPQPDWSLQLENDLPLTALSPRRSNELPDNRIGVHFEGLDRYSDSEHVFSNGFKWVRIQSLTDFWGEGYDLAIFDLESIPPEVDELISEYADNGVNIVLDLWLGAGLRPYGTRFQSEAEITQYLDYVRFVVSHFKGRIRHYQIWNEPGDMTPSEYANLVRQAVPVIREEDPGARIIIGAIPGSWENGYPGYGNYQRFKVDIAYLNELLLSGVAPMVDGISWHPFYGNMPGDPYYQNYPRMLQGIKELAVSQGFSGEYFADELLWATVAEPGWDGGPPVSRQIAAKYYTRAIAMHRGLDVNVTINTFFQEPFLAPIHTLCDTLAGAEPIEMPVSVEGDVTDVSQYAFALPDGDRLVALWTNGEAVEEDPGERATLTLEGVSAQSVTGIDVYKGLEQELITETENGDLVIRDLLVRDYPVILRLIE